MSRERKITKKYKEYAFFGSSKLILCRTKRRWAEKKNIIRTVSPTVVDRQDNVIQHLEDNQGFRAPNTNITEAAGDVSQQTDEAIHENLTPVHFGTLENVDADQMQTDEESEYLKSDSESDEEDLSSNTTEINVHNFSLSTSKYPPTVLIRTLLVMVTKEKHNLTYLAAEDILKLANVLGDLGGTHGTKYHWKNILHDFCDFMSVHHFCDQCHAYVGSEEEDGTGGNNTLTCSNCNHIINTNCNWQSGCVMICLSLTKQLQYFCEMHHDKLIDPKTRNKINKYAIEDIFDGKMYREKVKNGMISINFNIDGTPIFNSSSKLIYPVLCTINELPPKYRGKNVFVASLWFGPSKLKSMNEFLKPFVSEMQSLGSSGFEYIYQGQKYRKQCQMLVGICDSVPRPYVRNSTQFNGEYGCGLCLHPGIQVPKGEGSVRVYPIDTNGNPFGEGLREHHQTLIHARNKEKGMKSRSILCNDPTVDIIKQHPGDWAHAVALGVAKQFAKLWFDTMYHTQPFYLGPKLNIINEILVSFTPTLDILRTPRNINERQYWKAHEWAIWLLFYSLSILNEVISKKYVDHWALLVDGISILVQRSIMPSEIEYARNCLYEFVKGTEMLYGKEHVPFNVHLLTHLPDSVINWGPLWMHSAFVYESYNHELKTSVHSSNGVPLQICDTFKHKFAVRRLQNICEESMSYSQKKYMANMLNTKLLPSVKISVDNVGLLGKIHVASTIPRSYNLALQRLNISVDHCQYFQFAQRILIQGEVIHSRTYAKPHKRKSYVVVLKNKEIFETEQFIIVLYNQCEKCYAIGKYYEKKGLFQ